MAFVLMAREKKLVSEAGIFGFFGGCGLALAQLTHDNNEVDSRNFLGKNQLDGSSVPYPLQHGTR
jgi:hypothetical protein